LTSQLPESVGRQTQELRLLDAATTGDIVKIIAQNKKARHEVAIEENFEAGLELRGSEVKSLRQGKVSLGEAYVRIRDGEAFLLKANIAEYSHGGYANHEPLRPKKMLLHRREIEKLRVRIEQKGMTVVPLKIYFNEKGRIKLEIGVGKGKRLHDKRKSIQDRETKRQIDRAMKQR